MIFKEEEIRETCIVEVAKAMMVAARTAPKARGIDEVDIATITGAQIGELAAEMRRIGEATQRAFFLRDADNVEASQAVVIIGTRENVRGLDCGLCGFDSCVAKVEKAPGTLCSFLMGDVGIALGSAVSVAATHRVDNRIMFSAGVAAERLGLLPGCRAILAVPLSATGKSIYFDRQPKQAHH